MILAMSTMLLAIAHPALLGLGAGLVAVPVIIHLLFRRKPRVVRWAAMAFLLAAVKKQKRRVQVENLILLLLRCAAIALFALALARPALRAASWSPLGGSARGIVVIVDTSLSMAARSTGRRTLDRVRERSREVLSDLPDGSEVTVMVTGDDFAGGGPSVLIARATPSAARDRIDRRLKISNSPNDLGEVFRFARRQLAQLRGRKSVIFLTDLQERDWVGEDQKANGDVRRALLWFADRGESAGDSGEPVPVTVHSVGQSAGTGARDNVAITRLTVEEGREAFSGTTVGLATTLVNFGRESATGTLTLYTSAIGETVWQKRDPVQVVTIPPSLVPGSPRPLVVEFFVPLAEDQTGPTRFRAVFRPDRGPQDRLDADNQRYLALRIRPPVRILPIRTFRGALDLLKDVEIMEIISFESAIFPEEVAVTDLASIDVVVWADADFHQLDDAGAERLRRFVARGGGLLAYLGDYARPADRINELFFREGGQGLFPMLMASGDLVRRGEGDEPLRIDIAGADREGQGHVLFREATGFGSPAIFSYRPVAEAPKESVVARYNDEAKGAAVLEHSYQLGRVIIATTTPDERGFRMDGSLLPPVFFFNAVHQLVAVDPAQRNVLTSRRVEIPLPKGARRVSIEPPPAAGGVVEEPIEDQREFFSLARTTHPGFYTVTVHTAAAGPGNLASDNLHLAAVNLDPAEADLRAARVRDLERLYKNTTLRFARQEKEATLDEGGTDDSEMSQSILSAVAVLLFVELLAAWRFGSRRRRVS